MLAPAVLGTARGGVQRAVLRNRRWSGWALVSYGIYLWHDTVLALLARWDFGSIDVPHPSSAWPLAALAGAALLAAGSWYGLERPCSRSGASSRAARAGGWVAAGAPIADGLAAAPRAD